MVQPLLRVRCVVAAQSRALRGVVPSSGEANTDAAFGALVAVGGQFPIALLSSSPGFAAR